VTACWDISFRNHPADVANGVFHVVNTLNPGSRRSRVDGDAEVLPTYRLFLTKDESNLAPIGKVCAQ